MKIETYYKFGVKNPWKGAKIEPILKHDKCKILTEDSPLVADARYRKVKGNQLYDLLVYATGPSIFLISERLKNILDSNKFNGYKCFPIKSIEGIDAKYYGWINTNIGGFISKSFRIKTKEQEYIDKNIINLKCIQGYDIFHPQDTLFNVCSSQVKNILELNKISNIEFIPIFIGFEIDEKSFLQKKWDEDVPKFDLKMTGNDYLMAYEDNQNIDIPLEEYLIKLELYKLTQKEDVDFTVEDLHFIIRAQIGLTTYIPIAIDKIISRQFKYTDQTPEMYFYESHFYEGDLLMALLKTNLNYWNSNIEDYTRLKCFLTNLSDEEIFNIKVSCSYKTFKNLITNFVEYR